MYSFSKRSEQNLLTCHPDIVKVCRELIKQIDFSVLEGHRGKEAQEKAFASGNSKAHYPNSKHNSVPSHAVDLAPYPIDWNNLQRFRDLWTRFDAIAKLLADRGEIASEFEWGGEWNGIKDYPHIEIKEKQE